MTQFQSEVCMKEDVHHSSTASVLVRHDGKRIKLLSMHGLDARVSVLETGRNVRMKHLRSAVSALQSSPSLYNHRSWRIHAQRVSGRHTDCLCGKLPAALAILPTWHRVFDRMTGMPLSVHIESAGRVCQGFLPCALYHDPSYMYEASDVGQ